MTTHEMTKPGQSASDRGARNAKGTIEDHLEDVRTSDVFVNNQPVRLPKRRLTGAEIKAAAISTGVQIDGGFQLWWERGGGREQQVGDNDTVTTLDGHRFTAVAPDDNS